MMTDWPIALVQHVSGIKSKERRMNLEKFKTVDKVWGQEVWLVNNERYCAKLLHVNAGWQCSLHMHPIKKETFIVLDGGVCLEVAQSNIDSAPLVTKQIQLISGDSYTLEPNTFHRFFSYTDQPAVILEISSTHSDDDVVRLEESRPL
jgi:mannose-6-phosphate isomerase-like protein (cupin superfamily)